MRTSIVLTLAAVMATAVPAAQAEEKSAWSLSRNLSFVSDYYARGISQSWHKPAVQAGLDVTHDSGFYAGLWGSSISPQTYVDSTTEIDIYAGYNGSFSSIEKLGWSAGLTGYLYPGGNWDKCKACTRSDGVSAVSSQRFDTYEANAALSYDWISAKASVTLTDWFGANRSTGFDSGTNGTTYLEVNASYPLPFYDLMLIAHVGRLDVAGRVTPGAYGAFNAGRGNPDNTDYKIGLSKKLAFANIEGMNLGIYYVGADDTGYWSSRGFGGSSFNGGSTSKDLTDNRWVITLSSAF
jgi:uncharacterized protein (TIGR02001 family)